MPATRQHRKDDHDNVCFAEALPVHNTTNSVAVTLLLCSVIVPFS